MVGISALLRRAFSDVKWPDAERIKRLSFNFRTFHRSKYWMENGKVFEIKLRVVENDDFCAKHTKAIMTMMA
jgi:hypothetical protein